MKYCSQCGKECLDEAVTCPNCGGRLQDPTRTALCVLSALFPIFGLFYWLINRKSSPQRAVACGITALVATAIYALLFLFWYYILRNVAAAGFLYLIVAILTGRGAQ